MKEGGVNYFWTLYHPKDIQLWLISLLNFAINNLLFNIDLYLTLLMYKQLLPL